MSITRNLNGSLVISDMVAGYLVTRVYYGYTIAEAKRRFREEIKKGV